ncbi:MAG: long-chain fatty acid--CoA ligase, partial [Chloroflexi bacterium]|nr:long-chain fatty acid--CoA ligase [Chloroflexota bacterium]
TGYGMTEAVPITFVTAVEMARAPIGSVGQAVWGTAVMIVDEAGLRVPIGELGEIVVRGPQVFCGYYRRPLETAAAQRDDWFHTGDVGRVDEAGHLFIVDRIKDMIKRSGYAVYPAEVERVLVEHPAVAEAAVVGVPDAAVGEEIKACVVLKPGAAVTPDELIEHCKQQLAAYKCPRIVEVRDSLLKNPAGKIVRSTLRQA